MGVPVDRLDRAVRDGDRVAEPDEERGIVGPVRCEQRGEPLDLRHRSHVAQRTVVRRRDLVDPPQRPAGRDRVDGLVADVEVAPERHRPAGRTDVRPGVDLIDRRRDRQAGVGEEPGQREAVGERLRAADEAGPRLDPGDDR